MKQLSANYSIPESEFVNLIRTYLKGLGHSLTKYSFKINGNKLQAVEVITEAIDPPPVTQQLQNHRHMIKKHKKHSKVNMGLFQALKMYFAAEKARGTKTIGFKDLYDLFKLEFKELDETQLQTYLYDRRQFDNIDFSKTHGIKLS